jgi:hypothetical protein
VDEFASSGSPLEGDWVGFQDIDSLEVGTQRDVGQHTTGLHNAGLHYAGQSDAE